MEGVLRALASRVKGVFNISGGEGHTIRDVVTTILQAASSSLYPISKPRVRPASHFTLDISAARNRLGYAPKVTLEDGVRRTLTSLQEG